MSPRLRVHYWADPQVHAERSGRHAAAWNGGWQCLGMGGGPTASESRWLPARKTGKTVLEWFAFENGRIGMMIAVIMFDEPRHTEVRENGLADAWGFL